MRDIDIEPLQIGEETWFKLKIGNDSILLSQQESINLVAVLNSNSEIFSCPF